MLQVGVARLGYGVEVDVDNVIQHAHGGVYGAFQALHIQFAIGNVGSQVHRAQVAHGDFIGAGVQGDFSAQVGAVYHAFVLLRRAQVAGVFEGDPRVAGFKQYGEHFAPQLLGRKGFEQLNFACSGQRFVVLIALAEGVAV